MLFGVSSRVLLVGRVFSTLCLGGGGGVGGCRGFWGVLVWFWWTVFWCLVVFGLGVKLGTWC